jgi:hypothetical protein
VGALLKKYSKDIRLISPDNEKDLMRLKFSHVYKNHRGEMEALALSAIGQPFIQDIMHEPMSQDILLYLVDKALKPLCDWLENLPYIRNFLRAVGVVEQDREKTLDNIARLVMQDGG